MRRSLAWAVLAMLAVAIPVAAQWWRSNARIPVDVALVISDSVLLSYTTTGTLTPSIVADVGSRITGTLVELNVDEGASVTRGMALGRIAPEAGVSMRATARGARLDAEARVAAARVGVRLEERRLKRLRDIEQAGVAGALVPAQEIEAAESAVELAQANLESAMATLVTAEAVAQEAINADERVLLTAPFDGVVTRVHKRIGETVVPATYGGENGRVLTIARPGMGKVMIDLPERYALQLDPQDKVEAALLMDRTRELQMSVRKVRPRQAAGGEGSGFEAELAVQPTRDELPWGATVIVSTTVVAVKGTSVVPLSALVPDPNRAGGVGIFIVRADTALFVPVRVTQFGDVSASLADGPAPGTPVIIPALDAEIQVRHGSVVQRRQTIIQTPRRRTDPETE